MFEAARSSSAFKPYFKAHIDGTNSSRTSCVSSPELEKSGDSEQKPPSAKSVVPQSQPFDYTVEKLLCRTPSSQTSSPVIPSSPFTTSSLPLNLLTQHIWWQRRRAEFNQQTQPSATFKALPESTLLGGAHLRRFFLPAHSHQSRQARGPRRQRTTFTHEQTLRLEMEYHVSEYISRGKRFQLAEMLDLTENQIKIWFQNRRAKDKRIEKAIVEQQYRYMSSTSASMPTQLNLTNCTTCNYTKHQFANGSGNVVTPTNEEGASK